MLVCARLRPFVVQAHVLLHLPSGGRQVCEEVPQMPQGTHSQNHQEGVPQLIWTAGLAAATALCLRQQQQTGCSAQDVLGWQVARTVQGCLLVNFSCTQSEAWAVPQSFAAAATTVIYYAAATLKQQQQQQHRGCAAV